MAKTVLIVEDTTDVRDALKMLVEYQGYEVIVAKDGHDACRLAWEHIPDLILMDLVMPVFNGIEATRLIRSDPRSLGIPIVCVSSYSASYKEDGLAAGCDEVHTKTSFMDSFETTLQKYLQN